MANILQIVPEAEGDEMVFLQGLVKDMSDDQSRQFATVYRSRRKDPTTILIVTLLGFLGLAGIQRFLLGHIGMGLLFLFTGGICLIGTIIDLVNYKKMTFDYNQRQAQEISVMLRGSN